MKKKTVLKVLGGIAIAAVAIVSLVFYVTSGVTGAADKFFEVARDGNVDSTYALTSAELKNTASPEQLSSFIRANRFDQVAETSWSSRSIKNSVGLVEGTVTLDDGGVVPLSMQLVKEGGDWKIAIIELRDAGLKGGARPEAAQTTASGVPPSNVISNLARFNTENFLESIQSDDFEYFKAFWVDDVTIAELRESGAALRGEDAAIEALLDARPVVEEVVPLEGGGFETRGYFAAPPYRYDFLYQYLPDDDGEGWDISAIEFNLSSDA